MGCFSVYCGISKIAITAGMRCCVLPIADASGAFEPCGKLPAALPVFGKYDDYGGIEDIECDANTELLENHFGASISDICHFFTRGCIASDYVRDELKENKELASMDFMFIHSGVWDVMSSSRNPSDLGRFDFGNEHILKLLGFKHEGKGRDPRYRHKWSRGKKTLECDGTWCVPSIYAMRGWGETGFDHVVGVRPEDEWLIGHDDISILSHIDDESYLASKLGQTIGVDCRYLSIVKHLGNTSPEISKLFDSSSLGWKYINRVLEFRDQLQQVARVVRNMQCMSGEFLPHSPCVTPQCGDHGRHQFFLDAFAEINRAIVAAANC